MVRLSLIAYLIAATWLGPALCCCTVKQFASGCHGCQAHAVKKRPNTHSHCHSHHHAADNSAPAPVKPLPSAPCDCPCERHNVQQVAVVEQSVSTDSLGIGVELLLMAPAATLDTLSWVQPGCLAIEQHALESPYWNSRGILRAHHVLRC